MQSIIPNLSVANCQEVLNHYREVFGGAVKNLQTADGKEMFAGHEGKIIHAELHINDACILYLNDVFGDGPANASGNVSLVLQLENEAEINRIYAALRPGGTVEFELQKTFWGSYHAVVTDCYGIKWSLDYPLK